MTTESINIPLDEYNSLKKKAELADDLLVQLENSVNDLKSGKIKRI
ncbi:MAG: hypothetical protein V1859_09080 [archaeon]